MTSTTLTKGRKQEEWPEYPLLVCLDKLLKPNGFRRHGRIWRKDAPNTIQAIELCDMEGGLFDLRTSVWLKLLGDVSIRDVKGPWGKFHIFKQSSDMLPERLDFLVIRALQLRVDYAERVHDLYPEDIAKRVESYFEPREPLTPEWRCNTLRQAVNDFILPYLDEIEAKPESFAPPIDPYEDLDPWIKEGKDRKDDGANRDDLVEWLHGDGMPVEKIAAVLSDVFGWTPSEYARNALELSRKFPDG